jgi:hypothetical protein
MYEVSYSEHVIEELVAMVRRNPRHANSIRSAFREINRRLRIYPQFGQPLQDLAFGRSQLWVAVYSPLVVHYILVEEGEENSHRQVFVVRPFEAMPRLGIV